MAISKQELQINEEIRDREVLVIDADGEKKGVMSARDAQKLAYDQNLDLVKIAPQATPPVCRVMDYGKYCFEQQKREKEARKNQRTVEIKEIRMFSAIDTHDFETKVAQGKKFLQGCSLFTARIVGFTATFSFTVRPGLLEISIIPAESISRA